MTPLEEQVEKLAWEWGESAKQLEALARSGGDEESAAWVAGASAAREEDIDDLRALLPLEVTDEMVERGARAFWEGISASLRGSWSSQNITVKDRYRHLTRACLSAALTQPQTEIEGKPDGTWYDIPDGGGAATAAGAFDPDPLANPDCQECGNDDAGCLACGADANWDS